MILTTADVGEELARYMGENRGKPMDGDHLRALVAFMLEVPAKTPEDALACTAWLSTFLPSVLAMLPDDEANGAGPRGLVETACQMAERATVALEISTGMPRETYLGSMMPAN